MTSKRFLLWLLSGLALSFIQSFYLSHLLVGFWVIILSWREEEPWWLILVVGVFDDLLQLEPVGKGVLIYLGLSLGVIWLKRLLGLGKKISVKVNDF